MTDRRRLLVVNGPNLNLLGTRQPELYGATTLAQLESAVAATAAKFDLWVRAVQSSHEGVLIDAVHEARLDCCGIVINPGGFEVHLTNVYRREPYRHHSYVSAIADAVIAGAGPLGYDAAVRYLAATATGGDAVAPPA